MALNPELYDVLIRGTDNLDSLTALERARFVAIGCRTLVVWEHQFDEMRRGRLDEADVVSLQRRVFHALGRLGTDLGTRTTRNLYEEGRAFPEFAQWFEANAVNNPPVIRSERQAR
jgi:hypothetical protein